MPGSSQSQMVRKWIESGLLVGAAAARLERLGQRRRRAPGAEGLWLAFMGRPCGERNQLEARGDASVVGSKKLAIAERRAHQRGAACELAAALADGVALAHGAEIAHQSEGVGICDGDGVAVDDGKGEARPL